MIGYRLRPVGQYLSVLLSVFVLCGILGGCSGGKNFFGKHQEKLPGDRRPLLEMPDIPEHRAGAQKLFIPKPESNQDWTHSFRNAQNSPGHLALLGMPGQVRDIAQVPKGKLKGRNLFSAPVVYRDEIFVLDSAANLFSFPLSGGEARRFWSLRPEGEDSFAPGGGLVVDQGVLYAATGYGDIYAIDLRDGGYSWRFSLGVAVHLAPVVAGNRLIIAGRDGRILALNRQDGKVLWEQREAPVRAGLLGAGAPAIFREFVLVPSAGGELLVFRLADGEKVWVRDLFQVRYLSGRGSPVDSTVSPVVHGTTLVAGSISGRMAAVDLTTGEDIWSRQIGTSQVPAVSGNVVYIVDFTGRVVALDLSQGSIYWVTDLREAGRHWQRPVLAGGRIWLVSSGGNVVAVDALRGGIVHSIGTGSPVDLPPIVVNGHIYILNAHGRLQMLE